jgi:hypothetical protein
MIAILQICTALETKMKKSGIAITGVALDDQGKLVKKPVRMSVSKKIAQRKSKKIRVNKRVKAGQQH